MSNAVAILRCYILEILIFNMYNKHVFKRRHFKFWRSGTV
nr:MAG TPA: hypothetical protein [Bacteriophage sp.]